MLYNNLENIVNECKNMIHSFNNIKMDNLDLIIIHSISEKIIIECDNNTEKLVEGLMNMFIAGQILHD